MKKEDILTTDYQIAERCIPYQISQERPNRKKKKIREMLKSTNDMLGSLLNNMRQC